VVWCDAARLVIVLSVPVGGGGVVRYCEIGCSVVCARLLVGGGVVQCCEISCSVVCAYWWCWCGAMLRDQLWCCLCLSVVVWCDAARSVVVCCLCLSVVVVWCDAARLVIVLSVPVGGGGGVVRCCEIGCSVVCARLPVGGGVVQCCEISCSVVCAYWWCWCGAMLRDQLWCCLYLLVVVWCDAVRSVVVLSVPVGGGGLVRCCEIGCSVACSCWWWCGAMLRDRL
jgi:hypothetical protein